MIFVNIVSDFIYQTEKIMQSKSIIFSDDYRAYLKILTKNFFFFV